MKMLDLTTLLLQKQAILNATAQHVVISVWAVLIGTLIAVPLGIALSRHQSVAKPVMTVVGIIQTIPSLVLFGLAMPLLGIGFRTGLIVLIVYSILPILRNTYTGMREVEYRYIEAAKGMGMSNAQILLDVELPIALPVIIAGVRISTVYIISWATLAALIGAGGLGDLIFTGLQTYNYNMILAGALPACLLALVTGWLIGMVQRAATPKGLRHL
jgi:osmoprotectant transport system permease protein